MEIVDKLHRARARVVQHGHRGQQVLAATHSGGSASERPGWHR
jgi:hypothetical protein